MYASMQLGFEKEAIEQTLCTPIDGPHKWLQR